MHAASSSTRNIIIPTFPEVEDFVVTSLRGEILSYANQPSLKASCYAIGSSEIWGCSYHTPITLKFAESDYFRIQLQTKGTGATRLGQRTLAVTSDQAIISDTDAELSFGEGFEQKALRINRVNLVKKAATLLDMPLINSLTFEAAIDCRTLKFQAFAGILGYIENMANMPQEHIPSFIFAELEQSLYSVILGSFDHNYTQFLDKGTSGAAPWQVRRVEEYIHANWDQPIVMEDIVALAGCSARSIFRAFQRTRGYSPMEFVKRVRLQQARRMLLNAEENSVTRIAFSCGFTELGRFSRDYAQAYGELPSQTLKQSLFYIPV